MAVILISWGEEKPPQPLVDLMIEKAKAYHVIREPVFTYGYRWPNADGTAESYDRKCWHIRDDKTPAPAHSQGIEGCQGLLEGLQEGYQLALKSFEEKKKKK